MTSTVFPDFDPSPMSTLFHLYLAFFLPPPSLKIGDVISGWSLKQNSSGRGIELQLSAGLTFILLSSSSLYVVARWKVTSHMSMSTSDKGYQEKKPQDRSAFGKQRFLVCWLWLVGNFADRRTRRIRLESYHY